MKWCLLLLLASCTSEPDSESDTESQEPDPRRDRSSWPAEIGGDRPAVVHAPETYDGSSDLPLVVVLHGYGASGALQDMYFGLSARVEDRGMVLIVPDGTVDGSQRRFWNATDACCDFGATGVDDVGYLLGLVDEVEQAIPIDPARITFVGHSNGGFMAHRLACEAPDRIAGVVSLAGATFSDPAACIADRATSVLQIHGTEDTTIRFEGGSFGGVVEYPSAMASASLWADRAGCDGLQSDGAGDYDSAVSGEETSRQRWGGCEGDLAIGLWTMEGSAHIPTVNDSFRDAVLDWLSAARR